MRFLDPAVIARLGTMELKARTVVEGFLSGLHRSPYKGFSVEFAEYRQYLPGDDLSTLDWKVYARSDRHYVKKFEEETNLECHLLLDVSASMGYRGARADEQAGIRRRARGLAGLPDEPPARRDRPDGVRRPDRRRGCRPARGRATCTRCCWRSSGSRPGARSDVGRPLRQLADALVLKRSLVVLISDLLHDPEPVISGLRHLRFRGTRRDRVPGARSARADVPVHRGASRSATSRAPTELTADGAAVRAAYLRELAALTRALRPRAARRTASTS